MVWHTRSNREEIGTLEDMAVINSNNGKIWATSAKYGYIYNEATPNDTKNDN